MWKFCKNNYTFNETDKEIYLDGKRSKKSKLISRFFLNLLG